MPTITNIYYAQRRKPPFLIDRPRGYPEYSFVHFTDGIETLVDGKAVFMPPHSCILWRPRTPQYFKSDVTVSHDWFHFTGNLEPYFKELGLPVDTWLHPAQCFFISEIMQELQDEFFSKKSGREKLMKLKARELFLKFSRAIGETPGDSVSEQLRALRTKVLSDLSHPWSVEEMANRLSLSPSRFHVLYHSLYVTSPTDDLIRARIDMAKYELASTSRSVAQIAELLGYRNASHLSRQFKGLVGLSPQQYRKTQLSGSALSL